MDNFVSHNMRAMHFIPLVCTTILLVSNQCIYRYCNTYIPGYVQFSCSQFSCTIYNIVHTDVYTNRTWH